MLSPNRRYVPHILYSSLAVTKFLVMSLYPVRLVPYASKITVPLSTGTSTPLTWMAPEQRMKTSMCVRSFVDAAVDSDD